MNQLRNLLRGSEYKVHNRNNNEFIIFHRPSDAYVTIGNYKNYIEIIEGRTPNKKNKHGVPYRGRGIGTELRALATLYAILKNKPIIQTGTNAEGRSAARVGGKPGPTSTTILRNYLGWKENTTRGGYWESIFRKGNNRTKVNAAVNRARVRKTG